MNINISSPTGNEKKRAKPATQGSRFLKEFKEFTAFLRNLWGILAGISVLFPLSNVFMQIIPLSTFENGGVLVWFSARLFTAFATVVSLFLILWTFGQRQHFRSTKKRAALQKQAWRSFGSGLSALLLYLAAYYFLAISAFDVLGWESADVRRLLGEVPLLIIYSLFFALLTRAFVLLGMIEFFRKETERKD
jgi:hypothetical protein